MDDICRAIGATGAALLQGDVRTAEVPRTAGVDDLFKSYFSDGWHTRDLRALKGVPLLLNGEKVVTDQDLFTPDEIRRADFYQECLLPNGFQWFAGVGFWAGSALWGLTLQRTPKEGPFQTQEKRLLAQIADRLTETATLSKMIGSTALRSVSSALSAMRYPAIAIGWRGRVLDVNPAAQELFGSRLYVNGGRLRVADAEGRAGLQRVIEALDAWPDEEPLLIDPVVIGRNSETPLVARTLSVPATARAPFVGARALLVLSPVEARPGPDPRLIARVFALTTAEARLASLIAKGIGLGTAAEEIGIARETARNQLKSVFAKTNTHRQAELVALLTSLSP